MKLHFDFLLIIFLRLVMCGTKRAMFASGTNTCSNFKYLYSIFFFKLYPCRHWKLRKKWNLMTKRKLVSFPTWNTKCLIILSDGSCVVFNNVLCIYSTILQFTAMLSLFEPVYRVRRLNAHHQQISFGQLMFVSNIWHILTFF